MKMRKMSEKKSMKGMKWIIVLLAVFLVAGAFVGAAGAFTVTYNGNGASGSAPTDTKDYTGDDVTVTVLGKGDLEKTGYAFAGWNTAADGSGTDRAENSTFTITADTTLYAQWTADTAKFTVTYERNGATSGSAPTDSTQYDSGATVTVLDNTGTLAKTGYAFAGWNTAADGSGTDRAVNSTFTITADTTLYAKWTANQKFTVTYERNGATSGTVPMDSTQYDSGATVTALGNTGSLTKTGCTFAGWNTAADGSGVNHAENSTFTITADTTLYAQWTAETPVEIQSITVSGITPPTLGGNVTAQTVEISSTDPSGKQDKLHASGFKWTKNGTDVPTTSGSTFSEGTYVAEFTITADTGVTIKNSATVTAGNKSGTYSGGKATISYTLGKTEINSIDVSLTSAPAGGSAAPAISLTNTTDLEMGAGGVTWYEGYTSTTPLTSTSTLKYNTEYKAVFSVFIKNGNTQKFATAVSVTTTPSCHQSGSTAENDHDEPDRKVSVTLKFKTAAGNEINAVSLTMDAPATGSTVSTDVSKVRKESDAKYTVKSLSWHEGTDTTKNTLETSASFTSGKTYSVKIELTANEGYTFKDGITKSAVTVNSDEIGANPTVSADKKTLTLSYTFPQITSKITTVKLTINRPAANTTPSTSTSIVTPETSAKYTVKTVSWTEKGASAAAAKFEDGKEYTVTIVLESSSGYSFDSSIRKEDVTVNSSSSESAAVEETDGKSALTVKYTMKASVKPVITITPDPSSPKIPVGGSLVTVSFRYTITGNYESGSINFGDNSGTAALSTSGSGTVTHSYSNTGTYTVKATVYDKTGLELSAQTTSVTVGKDELTASFNSSPSSEDPYTVSFSATTSGTVTKWEWDLGDGTTEYTKSFTHTYKKAGDYTVQLTVYNGGIKDSTTKTITVVKSTASSGSSDDDDPFLVIGDTEVPSFFDIIAEFVHLLRSLFDGTLFSSGSDE